MADVRLEKFVRDSLRSGASRAEIERVLREAGWSNDQVADALAAYSPVAFAIPVPRPRSQVSARDAFLYLVMFGMLYFSAFNFGNLIFQLIHLALPDAVADQYRRIAYQLRWSTSAVLVTFPIFLVIAGRIAREMKADPVRRTSSVRKWLTYLTLAVAACIVAGDLVYLINGLLSGELTLRFILKSLTVALIAGAGFGYYLWSMREDERALAR
jgi:hypothetical protein